MVVRDLGSMLASLAPHTRPGHYVFVSTSVGSPPPGLRPVMTFVEDEGVTMIVERSQADTAGLSYEFVAAWITLQVNSALDGVGLTAAVSGVLAHAGISCNVVAAVHHDHLFVPADRADEATALLRGLSTTWPMCG